MRRDHLLWCAILLSCWPGFFGIEVSLQVAGGSLYWADLALLAGALVALSRLRLRETPLAVLALILIAAIGVLIALKNHVELRLLIRDARPYIYLALGAVIACDLLATPAVRRFIVTSTTWYLGAAAVLIVAQTALPGATLIEGVRDQALYYGTSSAQLAAERAQTSLGGLATFTLCGVAGYTLLASSPVRHRGHVAALGASSLVIIVASYSRNSIAALAAAIAAAILLGRGIPRIERAARLALGLGVAAFAGGWLYLSGLGGRLLGAEITAFQTRVLEGLTSNVRSRDSSVLWREAENRLARASIADHPVLGIGFGEPYRPRIIGEPFADAGGQLYVHDAYLGVMVKTGTVGAVLLLGTIAVALARLFARRREDMLMRSAMACAIIGVLASSMFAPFITSRTFSAVFGVALMFAWAPSPWWDVPAGAETTGATDPDRELPTSPRS
jgi:O-antigen ligase